MLTRKQMLGIIHTAAKLAGLDDETYRDKLEAATGKRSAKDCSDPELRRALDRFQPKPSGARFPHHAKVKALFIAAYNLGLFASGTDAALDSFVERQTGKQRLAFVTPSEAVSITEALKAMLAREGFVVPSDNDGGLEARRRLLVAQWSKLSDLKAIWSGDEAALKASLKAFCNDTALERLTADDLDNRARRLGSWIRRVMRAEEAKKAASQ